jgi:phosphatidate cytidylyltransferase
MQFLNDPIVFKILFYGFMLLGLATILTYLLSFLLPQSQTFPKVKKIIGGWWIISALLAFAVLLGQIGIVLLFLIASLIALKEFIDIQKLEFVKTREMVAMSLVTVVHYSFIILGWKNFFLFIVPLMSFIYLPFFFLARRKIDGLVQNLWSAQCGLMLCVYFLSFVPGLIFLNDNPTANRTIDPILAFFFLFFVTELNDVFQFICGKSFGRIKLIHEISRISGRNFLHVAIVDCDRAISIKDAVLAIVSFRY